MIFCRYFLFGLCWFIIFTFQQKPVPAQQQLASKATAGEDEESGSDESDGEEHAGQQNYDNIDGAYNPKDYAHLNVTAEIKDLFQYIERYKVQPVELETHLKCFIPDYIPSIGEMDAFIKVLLNFKFQELLLFIN